MRINWLSGARKDLPKVSDNLSPTSEKVLVALLLGFGMMGFVFIPFSEASFLDGYLAQVFDASLFLACCVYVAFCRRQEFLNLLVFCGIAAYRVYVLYMENVWLESIVNVEEYTAILGGERMDFGSDVWFYAETSVLLLALFSAIALYCFRVSHGEKSESSGEAPG